MRTPMPRYSAGTRRSSAWKYRPGSIVSTMPGSRPPSRYISRRAWAQSCTSMPSWWLVPCTIQRRWNWPSGSSDSSAVPGQQAPLAQPVGDDLHRRRVHVAERRSGPGDGEGGVGGLEHRLVDLALHVGEAAVDRQGAGDVGGVEACPPRRPRRAAAGRRRARRRRCGSSAACVAWSPGRGDGVVADGVALLARVRRRTPPRRPARPRRCADGSRQIAHDLGRSRATVAATASAHLLDLVGVLDQPQLARGPRRARRRSVAGPRRPSLRLGAGACDRARRPAPVVGPGHDAAAGPRPARRPSPMRVEQLVEVRGLGCPVSAASSSRDGRAPTQNSP